MRHLAIGLVVIFVTSGCVAVSHHHAQRGHGPPPHAPAHGYRHHHGDTQLVFDSEIGVYLVVGHPDYFFWDGHFLRFHGTSWEVSASLRGPWTLYADRSLPPGLRKAHPAKAKRGKHKHKGHVPAKGRW